MTLARSYMAKIEDCEKLGGEIMGIEKDMGSYGHFSDEIYNNGDLDLALKNENIIIKK